MIFKKLLQQNIFILFFLFLQSCNSSLSSHKKVDSADFSKKQKISCQQFIWPVQGIITSGYGWRWGRMHKGIDIAGETGTPIVAAADGVVTEIGWDDGYGNWVEVVHGDRETFYGHNERNLVKKGEKVSQGQQIAVLGNTGRSTGPHVHLELVIRGQLVDPMLFFPEKPPQPQKE
jgi:murein DD-endopeptidase MepM/ murein hydrolase activator NlpD